MNRRTLDWLNLNHILIPRLTFLKVTPELINDAGSLCVCVTLWQNPIVMILDPSDKFRPEKKEEEFRNYTSNNVYHNRVKNTYYQMHANQTVQSVTGKVHD